jgi:uncharacterized protein involved in exopolysaccharide biosynthesis
MGEKNTLELIDLLRVIWKWKWFIVVFAFSCSALAGIISFSRPNIYEVSMVIEPSVINTNQDGELIYLDSPLNIKAKIDSNSYSSRILKRLAPIHKLSNPNFDFKTIRPSDSNIVKITYETEDIQKGAQVLTALFHALLEEYHHYVDMTKSELDQKIALNTSLLDVVTSERNYLENEIHLIEENTKRTLEERSMLRSKGSDAVDKLSLLIYSNTIQQNIAYSNSLKKQLSNLLVEIERMKNNISRFETKKQLIRNVKLIQPPQPSTYPIKPKNKLNIAVAFVIGFIFSLLLAFFLEYLRRMRVSS